MDALGKHYIRDSKGGIYEIEEENLEKALAVDDDYEYLYDYKPGVTTQAPETPIPSSPEIASQQQSSPMEPQTVDPSTQSPSQVAPQPAESNSQANVFMRDKDGGVFEIPQANVEEAKKAGGIIVDRDGKEQNAQQPTQQQDLSYGDRALQFAQGVANIPAFGADLVNNYVAAPALNVAGGVTELAAKGAGLVSSGAEDTLNKAAEGIYGARDFYKESNLTGDVANAANELAGKDIAPKDTTGKILNAAGEFSVPLGNVAKGAKTGWEALKAAGKHVGVAFSGAAALEGTKDSRLTKEGTTGRVVEDFLATLSGMALGDKGMSLAKKKILDNSEKIMDNVLNRASKAPPKLSSTEDVGSLKKGAAKILALGSNPNAGVNAAAKSEGIDLPFEIALGGKVQKFLANTGLKSLFVTKAYNNVIENADRDMINAVKRKINEINPIQLDGEISSIKAKEFLKEEKAALSEEAEKLYQHQRSFLKETDSAKPINGFKAAHEILPEVSASSPSKGMQFVAQKISQIGKDWGWLPDLSKYEDSPELIKKINESWGKGDKIKNISAKTIDTELKALKQNMRDKDVIHGVETLLYKFINGLEKDISTVKNKEFLEARKTANTFFKQEIGERMRTNIATSLLKGEVPKDAFVYMGSAPNIRQLEHIMGKSEAAKEVMTSLKRAKLEQTLTSHIMDSSGTITYSKLSNLFNKSPEKQALLKQLLGEQYAGMKKLANIAQEFVSSGKEFGNPSKTTLSARDVNGLKDVLTVIGNTAATIAGSTALHGIAPAAAIEPLAIRGLSYIASDKKIVNAAIKYAEASQKNNPKDKNILGNRLTDMVRKFLKHQWDDVQKYPQASHVFSRKFRDDMKKEKETGIANEKEKSVQ